MQFSIERKAFEAALSSVLGVVSKRSTLPILSNVLLVAKGDALAVTASDLDHWVTLTLPADILKPGAITLPARRLDAVVKSFSGEAIELRSGDKSAVVIRENGGREVKLFGLPSEEFPEGQKGPEEWSVDIPAEKLKAAIRKTAPHASTAIDKPALQGIRIEAEEGALSISGAQPLKVSKVDLETETAAVGEFTLPSRSASWLQSKLPAEGVVAISYEGRRVRFSGEGWSIESALIDAKFPNVERMLGATGESTFNVDRDALIGAIRQVDCISVGVTELAPFVAWKFVDGELTISRSIVDAGAASASLSVDGEGEIEIRVNPTNFISLISPLDSDRVTLMIEDEKSPLRIDAPEEGFRAALPLVFLK